MKLNYCKVNFLSNLDYDEEIVSEVGERLGLITKLL